MMNFNLSSVLYSSRSTLDDSSLNGYHHVSWKIPKGALHWQHIDNTILTNELQVHISGNWDHGKLVGDCTIKLSNREHPKLLGMFQNSIIQKGKVELSENSSIKFDAIEISDLITDLDGRAFNFNGDPRLVYKRYFILKNGTYLNDDISDNQQIINGDFFCDGSNHVVINVEPSEKYCSAYIKWDYIGLLYYDLLASMCWPRIINGTIKYHLADCNVKCDINVNNTLTIDRRDCNNDNNSKYQSSVQWDIGQKLFSTIVNNCNQSAPLTTAQCEQLKCHQSYPLQSKGTITFKVVYDNKCDNIFNHDHTNVKSLFTSCELKWADIVPKKDSNTINCPYTNQQFSFIPTNGDKIFHFLQNMGLIDCSVSDYNQIELIFDGNIIFGQTRLSQLQVVVGKGCRMDVNVTLMDNSSIDFNLYTGECYHGKLAARSCFKKLSRSNHINNNLHKEINELRKLGCQFEIDEIHETMLEIELVCDKIKQCGIDAVCKLLQTILGVSKFDIDELVSWAQSRRREYYRYGSYALSAIQWEKIYQTQCIALIAGLVLSKMNGAAEFMEFRGIGDTQQWTILHYGAYLNNQQLIEIGKQYANTVAQKLEVKAAKYNKHRKHEPMFASLYLSKDIGGNLPIHIAAYFGNVQAIEILLQFQSQCKCFKNVRVRQLNNVNYDGCTPLAIALRNDQLECVKLLLKESQIDESKLVKMNFSGFSIFTLLASSQSWNTMQWLSKTFGNVVMWQHFAEKSDEFGQTIHDFGDQKSISLCKTKAPHWYNQLYS